MHTDSIQKALDQTHNSPISSTADFLQNHKNVVTILWLSRKSAVPETGDRGSGPEAPEYCHYNP